MRPSVRWFFPPAAALLVALTACGLPAIPQPAQQAGQALEAQGLSGSIQVHRDIASAHLSRRRDVWVYTPPGYEAAKSTRYPVLYMHDGNNAFDAKTAFGGHEWEADETANRMIRAGELPPLIIVGVGNTADRTSEYTWLPGTVGGQAQGGHGPEYARFLVSELKPMIDRTYRTKPDRANTAVLGSSLGGLMSLYLGRYEGEVFGKLGVMSPSLWWSDRAALAEAGRLPSDLKIWLDIGHREGDTPQEELDNVREFKKRLLARGFAEGKSLGYFEDEKGGHDERAWAYRLPMALRFLFGSAAEQRKR